MTDRKVVPHPSMNPLDRPLRITTFKSVGAFTKKEHVKSLREIIPTLKTRSASAKAKLPLLKLARFGDLPTDVGCLRHDDNVLAIDGIEIDYDGEEVSIREGASRFQQAGVAAVLYTSPSHTPGKPHWRALLPTSTSLPPAERERLVALANGIVRGIAAPESYTLSLAYFFGKVNGSPYHEVLAVPEPGYIDQVSPAVEPIGRYGDAYQEWEPEPDDELRGEPNLELIDSALAAIPVDCREDRERYYRPIGMALHNEFRGSEDGWAIWDRWAEGDGTTRCWNYEGPEDTRYTWNSFSRKGKTRPLQIGTLYYLAKKYHGWKKPNERYDIDLSLLDLATWLERDIPPPDFLLGELLSTTTRALLIGPTGLGKTNFSMAKGFAVATGAGFLHWKGSGKPRRVLIIDGEMSRRLMQRRLRDLVSRNGGAKPGTFKVLCREDFETMPPLNTKEGQRYVDQVIEKLGGVDLVILDNIQALNIGDMNDPASWEPVLPWMRDLTRREIGQLWVHHTGHDETHGYGSKTREWQLDTVLLMGRIDQPDADIAFELGFTKARERSPENRADFEPVIITLADDVWTSKPIMPAVRKTEVQLPAGCRKALAIFHEMLTKGEVTPEALQQECEKPGALSKPETLLESRQRYARMAIAEAVNRKVIMIEGNMVLPFHEGLE